MAGQTSDDLLALFDSAPLNRRYWVTFGLMSGVFLLDFFDFLGVLFGVVSVVLLVAAGYFSGMLVGGFPLFVILVAASAFFVEGGFSNLAPYTVEQYDGVRLGARSSGLGQAANGIGKILGPLALALLAGSGNVIAPKATAAAVFPAFVFLGVMMLAVALVSRDRNPWPRHGAGPGSGAPAIPLVGAGDRNPLTPHPSPRGTRRLARSWVRGVDAIGSRSNPV